VSILIAAGIAVGLCRGSSPALNTSMMRMADPQHGHDLSGVVGSDAALAARAKVQNQRLGGLAIGGVKRCPPSAASHCA
jgi:hypothetical protein